MSPDLRATDVDSGSTLGDALAGPGRGCGGCVVSGGFGCASFLVGSIAAIALFAPQLLGGWFARGATTVLTELVDGTVTVSDTELAWGDDQRLRGVTLRSVDGRTLAAGTVRMPSLTELVSGSDADLWHFRARLADADFVIDEEGVLDLARALYLDSARAEGERGRLATSLWRAFAGVAEGTHPPFLAELEAAEVTVSDLRFGGRVTTLQDVKLELGRPTRGGPAQVSFEAQLAGGTLALELSLERPEAALPSGVHLALSVESLGPEALELWFGERRWRQLVGGPLDLSLTVDGDVAGRAAVALRAESPEGVAELDGDIEAGVLRMGVRNSSSLSPDAARSARLEWNVDPDLLTDLLRPLVPERLGLAVQRSTSGVRSRARIERLTVDTGLGEGWWPTGLTDFHRYEIVGSTLLRDIVRVSGTSPGGAEYPIAEPYVAVNLLGELGGSISATWRDGSAAPPGSLTLRVGARGLEQAGPVEDLLGFDLPALPTELLDDAVGIPRDARLLLGDEARITLGGLPVRGTSATRPIDVSLQPQGARGPVRARFADGSLTTAGGPQVLSLPADRARLETALLPLFPWLTELRAIDEGHLDIAFEELEVPLGADALAIGFLVRGDITLRIPPVTTRLHPAIAASFQIEDEDGSAEDLTWFPSEVRLGMEDNVVRYEAVGVPLGELESPFRGTYDRKPGQLRIDLEGDVPVELVRSDLQLAPEELQTALGLGRFVRVKLGGTVDDPRLFVDSASVREVLSIDFEEALPQLKRLLRNDR